MIIQETSEIDLLNIRAEKVLSDIYDYCISHPSGNLSLMSGQSGSALFCLLFEKYNSAHPSGERPAFDIQDLAEKLLEKTDDPTFSTGASGIYWLFAYLHRIGIIDEEEYEFICSEDEALRVTSLNMLDYGNYDFLHGGLGIAYYMLYDRGRQAEKFFVRVFEILNELCKRNEQQGVVAGFDFKLKRPTPGEVNLSLSHGITSILKFCIEAFRQGICMEAAKALAKKITNYLTGNINSEKGVGYFPARINAGRDCDLYNRLAWCYGDLGISFILLQTGTLFNWDPVVRLSIEILEYTTTLRETPLTLVRDAGLCHGAAGIAHLYNKTSRLTQNPVFREAANFWYKKTLDYARTTPVHTPYERYNALNGHYEDCAGLIEGSAGVGLALLGHLTGDLSWDYFLMVN